MELLFLLFLGLVPGIFWLLFYLRQDRNREPARLIALVFLIGMFAAIVAVLAESLGFFAIDFFTKEALIPPSALFLVFFLEVFFVVAFVEEFAKYAALRVTVRRHREFDEPVDAMIYMVIAALGFATMENLLIFFGFVGALPISQELFGYLTGRFAFATPLHILASGFLGYFLALSILRKQRMYLIAGLALATVLHGAYNFSILESADGNVLFFLLPSIIILSGILLLCFRKLQSFSGTLHT